MAQSSNPLPKYDLFELMDVDDNWVETPTITVPIFKTPNSSIRRPLVPCAGGTVQSTLSVTFKDTSNVVGRPSTSSNISTSVSATPKCVYRTPKTAGSSSSKRTHPISTTMSTPRSVNRPSVIAAIVEGRGCARGEIGMASIDLKKPQLVLSQFSDSQTYVKTITQLHIIQALEIVMPNTSCENGSSTGLFKQIGEHFQSINVVTVQRRYFNETKGLQYINHLTIPECKAVELQIATKYYCLATAAALLKYVEFIQNTLYAPKSLKVTFTGSENTTMIDIHTAKNLELIINLKDTRSEHTLYGVLHNTKTVGGGRLLRANILQPPCDLNTINMRMDCIDEFLGREDLFFSLQAILERFLDVDHLLSLCVQIPKEETVKTAEHKIGHVIYLKHTLELVEPLRNALTDCKSDLLKAYSKSLDDPRYKKILEQIMTVIHDEAGYKKGALNMRAQRCHAVKGNLNGLLDVARRIYTETLEDIEEMIHQLGEKHGLPFRSGYSCARGFHIQVYCGGKSSLTLDKLPAVFIKKVRTKNTISFTTVDLIKSNGRISAALNEIYLMSNVLVSKLLADIVDSVSCLYKLTEIVSTLDMLISFAQACTVSDYVRPEFSQDTVAIKSGKHPILERISPEPPTANDTYICEETNFIIISGPNMSGKSTYMKQVALMHIMAQMGCFVPAEYASFRLTNHIFSRMGSGDDIATNSSTFMVEMKEVKYILSMRTDTSLILIDELGRGTSVEEGIGMCYAVCEELLASKAFTMLTTHFMELTYLDAAYPNVSNNHFQVDHILGESGRIVRLNYKHTMASGPTQELDYGIKLAELSNLPESILEHARQIAASVRQQLKANYEETAETKRRRATIMLAKRLIQVNRNSTRKVDQLLAYLQSIKQEYLDGLVDDETADRTVQRQAPDVVDSISDATCNDIKLENEWKCGSTHTDVSSDISEH